MLKGLKTQNLRDHMSEAELIFTALAGLSTRQIAENHERHRHEGKQGCRGEGGRHCSEGTGGVGGEDRQGCSHRGEFFAGKVGEGC